MSSIVAVMDRSGWKARTDNLVFVDPTARTLLWIPRDVWSKTAGGRINTAFARGGPTFLQKALREYGLRADGVLCLQRSATERGLAQVRLRVPVGRRLEFLYPLAPTKLMEDGTKTIAFGPDDEWLEGERIHQWLGARFTPDGTGTDFQRIERQKVFVQRLVEEGFDSRPFLENPDEVCLTVPAVLDELATVRPDWSFLTFGPVENDVRGGAMVLRPCSRWAMVRRLRRARFDRFRRKRRKP